MRNFPDGSMSDREKTLVAMGAAMAGGCRTCADKLHKIAVSLGLAESEMRVAFQTGLEAKSEAADTMRQKASSLAGAPRTGPDASLGKVLSVLVRIASFTAANSAPDAAKEIKTARERGVSTGQIQMCIGLGKMVRKNAITFSDLEISEQAGFSDLGTAQACCPASAGKNACSR